jgi:SAM-dependent methyltransferase
VSTFACGTFDSVSEKAPYSRYLHPRANPSPDANVHSHGLEVAADVSSAYHAWIAGICKGHLGRTVLDVGAGQGAISRYLFDSADRYVASDMSADCVDALRRRFAGVANVSVISFDLRTDELDETFDSIVLFNVLEHIFDDELALRKLAGYLNPGGNILIYVPAYNWLYGEWDRRIGHCRRYNSKSLSGVIAEADLAVSEIRYVDAIGIPAWFAFSRLGIRSRARKADGAPPSGELRLWDRFVVPPAKLVESHVRLPVGLNVLAIATLPPADSSHTRP